MNEPKNRRSNIILCERCGDICKLTSANEMAVCVRCKWVQKVNNDGKC